MSMIAMAVPILPGKLDAWRAFCAELMGPRHEEFQASRRRHGIRSEHTFLQRTPMGDLMLLVWEVDDMAATMRGMADSTDPFDQWTAAKAKEIHGIDGRDASSIPLPEPGAHIP